MNFTNFWDIILQLVSRSQIYLHRTVSELENAVAAPIIFLLQGEKRLFCHQKNQVGLIT